MKKNIDKYDHTKIEQKWQEYWEKNETFVVKEDSKKEKFFSLIEFPYPSGDGLHVGHVRSNTAMDIISRKRRMEGFNVLYPIGYDAFGLPTENYAIKTGIHPTEVTKKNIEVFRKQLKAIGFSFDWTREISTADPEYYRWTQWIFLKFLEKGLAYKKKMLINWCPKDKIGLANEEVIDGKCERCGTVVEKREKEQWMLAITKYADRLQKDLDEVNFLEKIKLQQRNWIGKSEGAQVKFKVESGKSKVKEIEIFTTRPDTLFGVTYLVLAAESEYVQNLKSDITNWPDVEKYIQEVKNRPEMERTAEGKEKTGIVLEGIKAINPVNNEEVPVWIADYVLAHYGTGAVMAVPAHDDRDFAFAKKYNLPIQEVIIPKVTDEQDPPIEGKKTVERKAIQAIIINPKNQKVIALKWKKFPWTTFVTGGMEEGEDIIEAAKREVLEETGYTNFKYIRTLGGPVESHFYAAHKGENRKALFHAVVFELIDEEKNELTPEEAAIHEVHFVTWEEFKKDKNAKCSEYDIWLDRFFNPEHAYVDNGVLSNSGKFDGMNNEEAKKKITELAGGKIVTTFKLRDWVFSRQRYWGEPIPVIICADCGVVPLKESDLPLKLPDVKNYQPTDNGESPLAAITDWVNVQCPNCGGEAKRETDTMPNWAGSSWYWLRYTDPKNDKEFASMENLKYWLGSPEHGIGGGVDWYNGGMEHVTLHLLYSRFWNKFLFDCGLVSTNEPFKKRTAHGFVLGEGGVKMSKSIGNVINPDSIVKNVGADTLRVYEMFMGPFDQQVAWSSDSIVGPRRFLEKVWKLQEKIDTTNDNEETEILLNQTIKKVSEDIESMNFNTAVSSMMVFVNHLEGNEKINQINFEKFIKILSPFAPHIAEEVWSNLGNAETLIFENWPKADESKLKSSHANIVIQINGKMRANISLPQDTDEQTVEQAANENPEIKKWLEGKTIIKKIFVKNKILNFVI